MPQRGFELPACGIRPGVVVLLVEFAMELIVDLRHEPLRGRFDGRCVHSDDFIAREGL